MSGSYQQREDAAKAIANIQAEVIHYINQYPPHESGIGQEFLRLNDYINEDFAKYVLQESLPDLHTKIRMALNVLQATR